MVLKFDSAKVQCFYQLKNSFRFIKSITVKFWLNPL